MRDDGKVFKDNGRGTQGEEIALQNAENGADSLRTTFAMPAGREGQIENALGSGLDIPEIPLASLLNVLVSLIVFVCLWRALFPSRVHLLAAQPEYHQREAVMHEINITNGLFKDSTSPIIRSQVEWVYSAKYQKVANRQSRYRRTRFASHTNIVTKYRRMSIQRQWPLLVPSQKISSWRGRPRCRVPGRALWDLPISMAAPLPVRLYNDLLLCRYEGVYGTHPVLLVRAAPYACQRNDTIVDDHPNLRIRN